MRHFVDQGLNDRYDFFSKMIASSIFTASLKINLFTLNVPAPLFQTDYFAFYVNVPFKVIVM